MRNTLIVIAILGLGCAGQPTSEKTETKPDISPTPPTPQVQNEEPDRAAEIRARNEAILERVREEELAREVERQEEEPAPEAVAPTGAPPERSSMEILRERANELEPRVAEIARTADVMDENFRRYIDACYKKYTTGYTTGVYAADGRDWFEVYEPGTDFTYGGTFGESIVLSNETTAFCRDLWSEVLDGSREVDMAMKELVEDARHAGVLPGHLRDLRRKYRLDWEGWTP